MRLEYVFVINAKRKTSFTVPYFRYGGGRVDGRRAVLAAGLIAPLLHLKLAGGVEGENMIVLLVK